MQKKRRIEGKTDYKARMNLLKSGIPRIVVRVTNKLVLVQYTKSNDAQDFVITGANSKELLDYGIQKEFSGSLKSLGACYLTGYLAGKKIKDKDEKAKAILDMGLKRNSKGSRIYAALKGVVDAGIEINYNQEVFPDEKSIKRKIDVDKIKENINKKFL